MQQKKSNRCGKYSFRLIGKEHTFFKGVTVVDFKPLDKSKKIKKSSMVPSLNKDKLFYTPTFIIPALPIENVKKFQEEYLKRIQEIEQDCSQLYEARPKNKNEYCAVCKCRYQDYIVHIKEKNHTRRSEQSQWQNLIQQQARIFKMENYIYIDSDIDLVKESSSELSSCIKDMETMDEEDYYREFSVADYLV